MSEDVTGCKDSETVGETEGMEGEDYTGHFCWGAGREVEEDEEKEEEEGKGGGREEMAHCEGYFVCVFEMYSSCCIVVIL